MESRDLLMTTMGDLGDLTDPNAVMVGVGQLAVAKHPDYLVTQALGSCVGLSLYDPILKQGGLAHIMLPTPFDTVVNGHEHRFASTAVPMMVKMLSESGSMRRRLEAKIAGGAAMFRADTLLAQVGERNVEEAKRQLALLNIPIVAEDTGERHARTVELRLDSGAYVVRSYQYGVKRL